MSNYKKVTTRLQFRIFIEQDEDGVFVASVPTIPGCYTEGDTFEEAVTNIHDVIKLHLEARRSEVMLPDDTKTEFIGIKNITVDYGASAHPQTHRIN